MHGVLLDFLRSPQAYRALGVQGERVETIETHHAWVFLVGEHALKLKKPVRSRWLDFSTPALRQAACREEWRLNQALAPGVYLGLVQARQEDGQWLLRRRNDLAQDCTEPPPVFLRSNQVRRGPGQAPSEPWEHSPAQGTADADGGAPRPAATDEDWLVLMRRLPAHRMLDQLVLRGQVGPEAVDRLARVLCQFWTAAPRAGVQPEAWCLRARQALQDHALGLDRQAWVQAWAHSGCKDGRWAHVAQQAQQALTGFASLLQRCEKDLAQRAAQRRIVCGHGDLRPEHVHLPPAPAIPMVIDRLEFSAALREVDPFDELAFLAMECRRLGAAWVGRRLFARCGRLMGDRPPHRLLRLYTAQRALLRAKLALAHLQESPVRDGQRWRSWACWYLGCAGLATGVRADQA